MAGDTDGGLSADEAAEMATLEAEASDVRGARFEGHHSAQYWKNESKQRRFGELLEKQAGSAKVKSTLHLTEPDASADAKIEALVKSADYWKNPAAQAEVKKLIEGQLQSGKAAPVEAAPEVIQAWAKALNADVRDTQVAFDRVAQIERGLTRESIDTFDGLSAETQSWVLLGLHPGVDPQAALDAAPAAVRDEFLRWDNGLNKSETKVIRQAMGR